MRAPRAPASASASICAHIAFSGDATGDGLPFVCLFCAAEAATLARARAHVAAAHGVPRSAQRALLRGYECPAPGCGRAFARGDAADAHIARTHGDAHGAGKWERCDFCCVHARPDKFVAHVLTHASDGYAGDFNRVRAEEGLPPFPPPR